MSMKEQLGILVENQGPKVRHMYTAAGEYYISAGSGISPSFNWFPFSLNPGSFAYYISSLAIHIIVCASVQLIVEH